VCEAYALNIQKIKEKLIFLLLFGAGTIGGLFGFVHAITFLLVNYHIQTSLFIMGLIIGGIPLITKIASEKEKFRLSCLLPLVLGMALVISLFIMENMGVFGGGDLQTFDLIFFAKIIVYSFIAAIAMVMPGISGAFVLVAFGVYDMFMGAIKVVDLTLLIPATIGMIFGIVFGAKMVLLLLKKYQLITYTAILGMVIGSALPLFPEGFGMNIETFSGIVFMILGGALSMILGKKEGNAA
jgi:putative membrane protein